MGHLRLQCRWICQQHGIFVAVLLWSAGATCFLHLGGMNGFGLAHWLMTYEAGLIKRGLWGSILYLPGLSAWIGIPVESLYHFLSHFILLGLVLIFVAIAWRVFVLQPLWSALTLPFFMVSSLISANAAFVGYLDQIFEALIMLMVWWILKRKLLAAAITGSLAVLVHETSLVLVMPLVLFGWLVRFDALREQQAIHFIPWMKDLLRRESVLLMPLACFIGLFIYYQYFLPDEKMRAYIVAKLQVYDAFSKEQDSLIRTMTTSFGEWYHSESSAFFHRFIDPSSWLVVIFPLLFIIISISSVIVQQKIRQRWVVLSILLLLGPLSLFLVAWDAQRIWSYPLLLGLLFIWILSEEMSTVLQPSSWLKGAMVGFTLLSVLESTSFEILKSVLVYLPLWLWCACALLASRDAERA